jgi:hypothetical protein
MNQGPVWSSERKASTTVILPSSSFSQPSWSCPFPLILPPYCSSFYLSYGWWCRTLCYTPSNPAVLSLVSAAIWDKIITSLCPYLWSYCLPTPALTTRNLFSSEFVWSIWNHIIQAHATITVHLIDNDFSFDSGSNIPNLHTVYSSVRSYIIYYWIRISWWWICLKY